MQEKENKKIRVVLIAETVNKGVGKHIDDLYSFLNNNQDFEVFVLHGIDKNRTDNEQIEKIDKNNRIPIKSLKAGLGLYDIKAYFEIKKFLRKLKPDIVHCHSSKAGLSGRIAAKRLNIKYVIYSPHAYYFLKYDDKKSIKKKIFIYAEKFLSKHYTDMTVTTSKKEDEVYLKYEIDNPKKRVLIEHGIDVPNITPKEIQDEKSKYGIKSEKVIGAMARFEDQKDPIGTFEILKNVAKNNQNVKCIFWGKGKYFDEITKKNKETGKYVIIPGETKNPDVSLKILDIFLTASLYEGLPYTLVETLALGIPIVSSKVIGNDDCVENEKNGLFFPAKNYDKAVDCIEKIIKNNSFSKYGKESFKIYKERFSKEIMQQKYEKLYKENSQI